MSAGEFLGDGPIGASLASVDERLAALDNLVSGAIDATCLDAVFQVVELPLSVSTLGFSGPEVLTRPMDVVHLDDRPMLLGMLGRARVEGLASVHRP